MNRGQSDASSIHQSDTAGSLATEFAIGAACYFVFMLNLSMWDVGLIILFGLFGIACRVFDWNRFVPLLAFSRGAIFEEQFRRAMMLSRDDPTTFLQRPISGTLLLLAFGILGAEVL